MLENLIIGYDLGNHYSRISWYNEKKNETENVANGSQKDLFEIPTALCRLSDGTWLAGQEAISAGQVHQGDLVEDFLDLRDLHGTVQVGGSCFDKKTLTGIFIRKTLDYLTQYFEEFSIAYITITMPEVNRELLTHLTDIAGVLGISENQIRIQNHEASFEHYVLSQKKELWQHDVGLFEYGEDGLKYDHLSINHKHNPVVAQVQMIPLNMYMSASMQANLSPVDLDRKFLDVLNQVLSQKILSTIFLSGRGFGGEWMKLSLKKLCAPGRRVFLEDNIYAAGACYSGLLDLQKSNFRQFIALNDDIVPYSMYLKGSRMKENIRNELVSGGTCWYQTNRSVTAILDDTDMVVLYVRNMISHTEKMIPLKLEGLPERPNRTIRIKISVWYENSAICCVDAEDLGFGGLFPASGRTWHKRINVSEYDSPKDYQPAGRLIFGREEENTTPFNFSFSHTKVYSIEELCYYVYNNIYLISEDVFGEDLFYWMEKSLMEPALAKGLRGLKKSKASLKTMVQYLMNWADYYSNEEYNQFGYKLDEIERQNPVENRKIKADNLVKYCRYMEAVSNYAIVAGQMEKPENADLTKQFKAEVYHNMACAYMRLMNFGAAAVHFKKAYETWNNENSLKCCLWAMKMREDESAFFDTAEEYQIAPEYIESVLREYDETAAGLSFGQRPDDSEVLSVIKRLKEAYRN